jgi:hypothetical protein
MAIESHVKRLHTDSYDHLIRRIQRCPLSRVIYTSIFSRGKRLFGKVDGLPGAGHYKSLLLRHRLNSSP